MNYAAIKDFDIANGPGIRVSLFVSGCPHHCYNCFNPETWDYNFGQIFTNDTLNELFGYLDKPNIAGLTILGGEPLAPQNLDMVASIVMASRIRCPKKTIWIYSGYTYDEIVQRAAKIHNYTNGVINENKSLTVIMETADVLVDGRFVEDQKSLKLRFRGSSNQRIIDLQKTCWSQPWYETKTDPVLMDAYM